MSAIVEHRVTEDAVSHIVRNMRQRDREEIFAVRWDDNEDELIADVMLSGGALWRIWSWKDEPVALCGATPVRPGVVIAAAFGTDRWRYTIRPMTAWVQRWVIPALQNAGYHRAEAYVSATNLQSRRWLDVLGAHKEAYLHQYGRNLEDYILYVLRLNDAYQPRKLWRCHEEVS